MFYNARWYDPAIGRFTSADTVVAGENRANAQTVQDVANSMFTPLTVNYSETPILTKHNADSAFIQGHGGTLKDVKEEEKKKAKIVDVPLETQVLDRYAYTLNNPVRYTDPTGHICKGDSNFGWCEENGVVTLMMNGYKKVIKLSEISPDKLAETLSAINNFKQAYQEYENAINAAWSALGDLGLSVAIFFIIGIEAGLNAPADLIPILGQIKFGLEVAALVLTGGAALKSLWEFINAINARDSAKNDAFDIFIELPYQMEPIP